MQFQISSIETPENTARCINNCCNWHVSFNKCLVNAALKISCLALPCLSLSSFFSFENDIRVWLMAVIFWVHVHFSWGLSEKGAQRMSRLRICCNMAWFEVVLLSFFKIFAMVKVESASYQNGTRILLWFQRGERPYKQKEVKWCGSFYKSRDFHIMPIILCNYQTEITPYLS